MIEARALRVRGVVQGVGFRPFVYRLAQSHGLCGWVRNGDEGVEIRIEGAESDVEKFIGHLKDAAPAAAQITEITVESASVERFSEFTIRESRKQDRPTARISPDLPVCDDCLRELFDSADRRYLYPYINCTNCGPRYTVTLALPYDRPHTTMRDWPLDEFCRREYEDPGNRRFHAQPVACAECGPHYFLRYDAQEIKGNAAILETAEMLSEGKIVAIKGLGGYHLACDAHNPVAVQALRDRKYRKEKPFALMAKDLAAARSLVQLSTDAERLLVSMERPIVLAPAVADRPGVAPESVAPDSDELGVMLPYTPLQHLLFAAGAPDVLVMTSANRSSEPIAYEDEEACSRLSGIADAFLIGERPIARRVDDSVARAGAFGPAILRRARGYAPGAVCTLPVRRPILAVGSDLKNTVTLAVNGQCFVSQHIGDLDHFQAFRAFEQTIQDLLAMYEVPLDDLLVVHDAHPQYASTRHALALRSAETISLQHHRSHVASVLAERGEFHKQVLGVSFDGTGYGDDGTVWGGEIFSGSIVDGFERVAHLRPAALAGGDAAAQFPVQAAAGFLAQLEAPCDFCAPPFRFPTRYRDVLQLIRKDVRTFATTSMGRLFDAAAALLGFTREISFEGQAAMWLEHCAAGVARTDEYPFPFADGELDFRPLVEAIMFDRLRGRDPKAIARAFQAGVARGAFAAVEELTGQLQLDTVVLSGGVFQNEMLLNDLKHLFSKTQLQVWTNHAVPANDGGISLGQAAIAAMLRGASRMNEAAPAVHVAG